MPIEQARSVRHTWLYTLGSIVFFIGFFAAFMALLLLELLAARPEVGLATLIVLQLVAGAMQVRFCWFLGVGRGGGLPSPWWVAALLAPAIAVWVLGLFVTGAAFVAGAALWAAMCLIAALIPQAWRWPMIGAGAILLIAHVVLAAAIAGAPLVSMLGGGFWLTSIYAVLLPFMVLSSLWWWEIVVELDRHRRAAGQLAVAQERLRFASDLHDIQGHHLQVISLKAELAERLLARDPDAARDHIHEVRLIAKEAMEETRSLVAGYRQVSLDDELENAREVLAASGARCAVSLGDLPEPPPVRSALASVVREATTNILRHSSASEVSFTARAAGDGWTLEIANDGLDDEPPSSGADGGSGLAGLSERLSLVGGSLHTRTEGGRFIVRATVPDAAPAAVPDAVAVTA